MSGRFRWQGFRATTLPSLAHARHASPRTLWDNYDEQAQLVLHEIALEHLGGFDADGSGRRDWVESYLEAVTGMDTPRTSWSRPPVSRGMRSMCH